MWGNEEAEYRLSITLNQRVNDLNILDDFRLLAYESASLYNLKIKNFHDQRIQRKILCWGTCVSIILKVALIFGKDQVQNGPDHSFSSKYFNMERWISIIVMDHGSR